MGWTRTGTLILGPRITSYGELEKLTIRDKYSGHDHVHMASGTGMEISHIGSTFLRTHDSKLHLKNILRVPKANKSLISVN
jgi:hypothetical protein